MPLEVHTKNSPSNAEGELSILINKISYRKNTIATKCEAAARLMSRCQTKW